MLISAIISLIISVLVFSFVASPTEPNFDLNILGVFAGEKGKVLGVGEGDIDQAVGKAVEEIKKIPLVERILPESKDKLMGPQKLPGVVDFTKSAKNVVAVDRGSGAFLFSYHPDETVPIASLTKLMTALVFLDYNPGWDSPYEIKREERREGGKIYLFLGEKVIVKDLFYLSLIASANTATTALVNSTGLSEEEFVKKMNEKAIALKLSNTRFSDPIGLNNNNVSTAGEVAQLVKVSLEREEIREATLIKEYSFKTLSGKRKRAETTDYLLKNFPGNGLKIMGGKTGYTDLAGYCFAGEFAHENNKEIITVILGSPTSSDRFKQTKDLAEWVYSSYQW